MIINKIIGFIMIAFGIAMLLVSLFVIGFSISDAILTNYRTIGVIKSLGLSSRDKYHLCITIRIVIRCRDYTWYHH